jgi:hypothetical protein
MISRVTPHLIDLTYEALLRSFWRKDALRRFLRNCGISERFIASWGEQESKRNFLDRVFEALQKSSSREAVILRLAQALSEQQAFPDLAGWEDSAEKLADAHRAVANLKSYLAEQQRELDEREHQMKARKRFTEAQSVTRKTQLRLEELSSQLNSLVSELGTQEGGYKFQDWFYDQLDFFDIPSRRPYWHAGRQIDGSITLKDTTYLVELKFTATQADVTEVDSFIRKVTTKADNTMGIFVSMPGFSSVAIAEASKEKSPILLFEHTHIYYVLGGSMSFPELVDRVRRHASQTGKAFLEVSHFNG